ncbi:MAG: hypothetical protein DRP29_09285, partial [Thermodesulfobacteriota bacterium]
MAVIFGNNSEQNPDISFDQQTERNAQTQEAPKQDLHFKDRALRSNPVDEELEQLLAKQRAKIKVVGCGGGGNNSITRMSEIGIAGAETIAVNTDAQDLLYTVADMKILIGKELTQGLGAGSIPQVGEEAARESEQEIKQ